MLPTRERKVKVMAFGIVDCQWGTLRDVTLTKWEFGAVSKLLHRKACPDCKVVPCTITYRIPKKRGKK